MPGTVLYGAEDNQSPFPHEAYIAVGKIDNKQTKKKMIERY